MKGSEEFFLNFIEGANTHFIVPVYQRNYEWRIEQCRQLYDDLVKVAERNKKSHFFGSIVSTQKVDGKKSEFLIIDGQQRITTVSLLLLAAYKLLDQSKIKSSETTLKQRILEEYLIDKFQPKQNKIKLKTVKDDLQAYELLFDDKSEPMLSSNLTINFKYFYDRIQKRELTIDELFDSISKLQIINIFLGQEDNPQLIFESLNSTGMDLSEGDKIRNYVLMGLPPEIQEAYYAQYWKKIEGSTNFDVSSFIRDFLSIKNQTTPTINKVYPAFKTFTSQFEDTRASTEPILSELLKYAKMYKLLLELGGLSFELDSCIKRLNFFEATVTRPFLLEVLIHSELNKENTSDFNMATVEKIFSLIETYLFRRQICDIPTNALNKIFVTLHKDVQRIDGSLNDYYEKLTYVLLRKKDSGVFPDDGTFMNAMEIKPIYQMRAKNKLYILERFENWNTREVKNVWDLIDKGILSIEHIMPKTLTQEWRSKLGEEADRIHAEWIDRIANLTLTAYNSKYSNHSFVKKRDMENGFSKSGIAMNQMIASFTRWTETEIKLRNQYLLDEALKIWPMAKTSYIPKQELSEIVSLADDFDFIGKKLVRYSLNGIEYSVNSWAEMLQEVSSSFYHKDPNPLLHLVAEPTSDSEINGFYKSLPEEQTDYVKIDEGVYLYKRTNTKTKISILRKLFVLYLVEESDLLFFIEAEEDSGNGNELVDRQKLNEKFWTLVLPSLKNGTNYFTYSTGTKYRWMATNTGVKGVQFVLVAGATGTRVEFYLGSVNKFVNKSMFKLLKLHENQIQESIPYQLNWTDDVDNKSAKCYIERTDLLIDKEEIWDEISEFLVSGVNLFENHILPIVQAYNTR